MTENLGGMGGFDCVLEFDTDTPEFARGVEIGRLWTLLLERPEIDVTEIVHATNAEMLLRMSEATGRPVQAEQLDDTWLEVTFGPDVME